MKRINFIISSILFLLMILLINMSWAQTKSKSSPLTAQEKEILLIPSLANQGYLSFDFHGGGFIVQVEPLFWQKALHRDKVALVKAAMTAARFMNEQKNLGIRTVMFLNMTTHEELAYGSISGINPGKIEILK